jgi:hypothetical protein
MSYELKNKDHHLTIGNSLGDMLLEKTAKVTGAHAPDLVDSEHAGIPYEQRRRTYMRYVDQKSRERKTSGGTAIATGALVGGGLGALAGPAGAVAGALGGGVLGYAVKAQDDAEIRQARQAIRDPEAADEILSARMARRHTREREQDRAERRAATYSMVRAVNRPRTVNNYNTRVNAVQVSNRSTYNKYR